MTRVIMHGCNGHMGQVITKLAEEDTDVEIVAGVDPFDDGHNSYPVFSSIEKCDVDADVVIDFSSAKAEDALIGYCTASKLPSEKVAVLKSANMSLGINTLFKLLQDAARVFCDAGFDVELVEKHHNKKLDAPSGTALALADSIKEVLGSDYFYKFDRSGERAQRNPKEIGISAVRGGTIVGEHEVIFAGEDEVIEFKHTAYSKSVFAKGSIEAAKFLAGKPAGYYDMRDVIAAKQ